MIDNDPLDIRITKNGGYAFRHRLLSHRGLELANRPYEANTSPRAEIDFLHLRIGGEGGGGAG